MQCPHASRQKGDLIIDILQPTKEERPSSVPIMFRRTTKVRWLLLTSFLTVTVFTLCEIIHVIYLNKHSMGIAFLQEASSPPSHHCIEDNICKSNQDDKFYIYNRKTDFIKRVDAKIDTTTNCSHESFVVPNIVHFVQYTDTASQKSENDFQFHNMLSVLSAHRVQNPDRIYFWLDAEPESKYWRSLKQIVPMYLIKRERPTTIRGRKIHLITKVSNIIRLEAVLEYGGIYLDLDVVVVKSLDPLRKYDVTMGKEDTRQFCNAVIIAKPWADFLRKWHQEHGSFDERIWTYHSGTLPYYMSEVHDNLIHVEETSFFRPAYYELDDLFKEGRLYNWRMKNFCIHLWIRLYKGKRRTELEIDRWNTTVGEVYRYILYGDWRLR